MGRGLGATEVSVEPATHQSSERFESAVVTKTTSARRSPLRSGNSHTISERAGSEKRPRTRGGGGNSATRRSARLRFRVPSEFTATRSSPSRSSKFCRRRTERAGVWLFVATVTRASETSVGPPTSQRSHQGVGATEAPTDPASGAPSRSRVLGGHASTSSRPGRPTRSGGSSRRSDSHPRQSPRSSSAPRQSSTVGRGGPVAPAKRHHPDARPLPLRGGEDAPRKRRDGGMGSDRGGGRGGSNAGAPLSSTTD